LSQRRAGIDVLLVGNEPDTKSAELLQRGEKVSRRTGKSVNRQTITASGFRLCTADISSLSSGRESFVPDWPASKTYSRTTSGWRAVQ
jgi:hypothetical protein